MLKIHFENKFFLWTLTLIVMLFVLFFWIWNVKQQIVSLQTQYSKNEEISEMQSLLKNGFQEISTSVNEGLKNRPRLLQP